MVPCYSFHWNCLKEFAVDMSWLCYPVGRPEYLYLPFPGAQKWSLMPWCAVRFAALIFGVSVSPIRSTACRGPLSLWGSTMSPHGPWCSSELSVPWHRLALECRDSVIWSGFLVCPPRKAAVLECAEVMKSVGTFQKHSFSWVFPGACSDTRIVSSCVLLSPCCYHTNLMMSWLPALCRNCSMHCWGSYFHVGAAFPATLTPRTQLLSDSGQKRHDIFYSSRTIYLHFWHLLMCWTSWYKLSDSYCTLQYFKNCSVNHCNLSIRALNWIQETQFWFASALLTNCRWDTLVFLVSFLSLCRTLIAILICL